MSSKIVFIAPYRDLAIKAETVIKEMREDIDVYVGSFEGAVDLCKKLTKDGANVFISRGGNSEFIQNTTTYPVVNISSNLGDYVEALKKAQKLKGKVGVFCFKRKIDNIETAAKLISVDIKQYIFNSKEDAKKAVEDALADGIVMGMGGDTTGQICIQNGIDYERVASSEESIVNAIVSAKEVYRIKLEEQSKAEAFKIQMENYKAVVNFSYNGVIGLDKNYKINVFNSSAEEMLNLKSDHVIGQDIYEILPEIQLKKVMESGISEYDVMKHVRGKQLLINRIPIKIGEEVQGLVATFQDFKTIQESERKIRRKLTDKGLVAKYSFENIKTDSENMKQCIEVAKGYAKASSTVLIHGETGTGKELFAQSIHQASQRKNGPFVAINCAALPEGILESELFGYEEGTFTGAKRGGKVGLFEMAHEGTIFLDEIAEIPIALQAQLLRVLQERQIRRLGSEKVIPVDVRVITATNKNLAIEVSKGNFRQDLFYRINVLKLSLPPLRNRRADIKKIGLHFVKSRDINLFEKNEVYWNEIFELLNSYEFNGNVRELYNILERTMVVLQEDIYSLTNYKQLLSEILNSESDCMYTSFNRQKTSEKEKIVEALEDSNWSKSKAAELLGMSRSTLWRKIKEYKLDE